jgi:hypothetical protein
MPLFLRKIISGGQTGADMGALLSARELGIESGGVAPKGWLTENGPQEAQLRSFGLLECEQDGYPARTLVIGPYRSGGTRLTYETATELHKPLFLVPFPGPPNAPPDPVHVERFRTWLDRYSIQVLNVAGSRESQTPGIAEFTHTFLVVALGSAPH